MDEASTPKVKVTLSSKPATPDVRADKEALSRLAKKGDVAVTDDVIVDVRSKNGKVFKNFANMIDISGDLASVHLDVRKVKKYGPPFRSAVSRALNNLRRNGIGVTGTFSEVRTDIIPQHSRTAYEYWVGVIEDVDTFVQVLWNALSVAMTDYVQRNIGNAAPEFRVELERPDKTFILNVSVNQGNVHKIAYLSVPF